MFLPQEFDNNNNNANPTLNQQQRQRRRLFQTLLFICFMLLLLDNKNEDSAQRFGGGSAKNSTTEKMDPNLQSMLKNQPKNRVFPSTVSGLYSGLWSVSSAENASTQTSFVLPEEYYAHKNGKNPLQEKAGLVFLQLFSSSMTGSKDVSIIRGAFRAFNGMHTTSRKSISKSIIFNFQGLHFVKTGKVVAAGNLMENEHVSMIFKPHIQPGGNENDDLDSDGNALTSDQQNETNDGKSTKIENADHRKLRSGKETSLQTSFENSYHFSQPHSIFQDEDAWFSWSHVWRAFGLEFIGSEMEPLPSLVPQVTKLERKLVGNKRNAWMTEVRKKKMLERGSELTSVKNFTTTKSDTAQTGSTAVTYTTDLSKWKVNQQNSGLKDCVFLVDLEVGPKATDKQPLKSKWANFLNGTIYSPNCDVALKVGSQALRVDWESAYKKAVNYSVMMTLVCLLQLGLLFKQLHFSQNQAAASKVSMLCIGQQAILDAMLCLLHLLLCATWQPLFAAFASISFFKLVTFCIFEMRYLILIFQSRQPQSFFADGLANLRREMASLHGRFYVALFGAVILAYTLQSHFGIFLILMYSYWVPQIVCNARRNTCEPFHPAYLFFMALSRLALPLYFFGCPRNFLTQINPNLQIAYGACFLLVCWTLVQVAILVMQDKYGAQFFIPQRFLPPKYNYRRPMPESLRGENAPLTEAHEMDVEAGNLMECAICQVSVEVSTEEYMLTPCDHIFHEECLAQWMNIKMECPTCRAQLPPP